MPHRYNDPTKEVEYRVSDTRFRVNRQLQSENLDEAGRALEHTRPTRRSSLHKDGFFVVDWVGDEGKEVGTYEIERRTGDERRRNHKEAGDFSLVLLLIKAKDETKTSVFMGRDGVKRG